MQGRVLVADFAGEAPAKELFCESWGQSRLLNGWHDPGDVQLVGDFRGLGHDQVLFINQTILTAEEQLIIDLTNEKRLQDGGCNPVQFDFTLMGVAQAHSEDLARNHPSLWEVVPEHKGHYGSDGSNPNQRIQKAMPPTGDDGENVGQGYENAQKAFDGWYNEPGHRERILDCNYSFIGVGIAQAPDGTPYYTQDFWTPRPSYS